MTDGFVRSVSVPAGRTAVDADGEEFNVSSVKEVNDQDGYRVEISGHTEIDGKRVVTNAVTREWADVRESLKPFLAGPDLVRDGFGFSARVDEDGWRVDLPHQCDGWTVSAVDAYWGGVPREQAVARMEVFIAEAQACLAALRRGEEFGPDRH